MSRDLLFGSSPLFNQMAGIFSLIPFHFHKVLPNFLPTPTLSEAWREWKGFGWCQSHLFMRRKSLTFDFAMRGREKRKEGFLICIFVPHPPPLQYTDRGESYSPWRSWRTSWCMVTKPFLTFATKCSRDASRVPTLYHPFTLSSVAFFTKIIVKEIN